MRKYIGLIVSWVILIFGAIIIPSVLPTLSSGIDVYEGKVDNGYEITRAEYDITVSEDHSARVVETITVAYYSPSNGIARYLPTNSGEQYTGITVEGDVYSVNWHAEYIEIDTGGNETKSSKKAYQKGDSQTYVISYKIVPPVRTIGNSNYYMNVVPFGWDTSQSNVSITMNFPFEIKDIEIFVGKYDTTDKYDSGKYTVDGSSLTLHIDRLAAFNGVTADVELGRKFNVNFSLPGLLAILIILALIAGAICLKLFGIKDRQTFPVINAKPPHDNGVELDPAQMGFLIDNRCDPQDITALIFYFASKGLLRIETQDNNNFILIKTGEIEPGAPLHQKIVFDGLFKNRNAVSTKQLQNTFYTEIENATAKVKSGYKGKLSEPRENKFSILAAVAAGVVTTGIAAIMALRIHFTLVLSSIIIPAVIMAVFIALSFLFGRYVFDNKHKLKQKKLFVMSVVACLLAVIVALIVSYFVLGGIFPFYARMIIFVGLAVAGFVCGLCKRKSEYYASLMNEITGFKEFLETAEKDRLEAMLEENPQYYYDILPYANVLGVSKKWEDKFASIKNVPPPSYYNSPTLFDIVIFNAWIHSSTKRFTAAMTSRPSNSSRSGGGGGHFGGGRGGRGFGGGGGGRR